MLKKTIKIIALFIVFSVPLHFALSDELIIPKKKPMLSEEVINQKLSKGEIIPLKKPSETKETIIIKKEIIEKNKITKIIDGEIIPKSKYVEFVGLINKNDEMAKFVSEIRSWHYGTLFSVAEAYGISNRECLMLGVPVICNNVGGIPSTFPDYKCGKLFNLEDDFSVVGDWIINQILNYNKYLEMRLSLSKRSYEFSWEYTLKNIFRKISATEN